jgi:hypothetical protein
MIFLALAVAMVLNPDVTQATIYQTICVPGWTKTVRPPAGYTHAIKRQLVQPGDRLSAYELDHWIPLGLGGAPYDRRNLILQPLPEARRKDRLEAKLHEAVCAGRMSLPDAQLRIDAWK